MQMLMSKHDVIMLHVVIIIHVALMINGRLEHHVSAPSSWITCIIITAFNNNIILCNLNSPWSHVSLSPLVLLLTCLCNVSYMGKMALLNAVMIRRRWSNMGLHKRMILTKWLSCFYVTSCCFSTQLFVTVYINLKCMWHNYIDF